MTDNPLWEICERAGRVKKSYDRYCYLLALLAFILLGGGEARAWGDLGHKVICEIAFRLAQPDTRAAINRLIQLDSEYKTFSDSVHLPGPSPQTSGRAFPKSAAGFQRTYLRRVPAS